MKVSIKSFGLTLALFSFLALIPMSCGLFCQDSCGCGPGTPPQELIIKSMQLNTLNLIGQPVNPLDTLCSREVFKALQVKDFEIKTIADTYSAPSFTFGTAFACSPLPAYSRDEIATIKVINKKQLAVGDGLMWNESEDITAFFGMGYFFTGKLFPIEEFIGNGKSVYLGEFYVLGFNLSPTHPIKLEFDVLVRFKSNKEFLIENQVLSIR